jgi:hypothetical protein
MSDELREVKARLAEALLVDMADIPDDEIVPIGRITIEAFRADEKGYDYPADFAELELTAGEIRTITRRMREETTE